MNKGFVHPHSIESGPQSDIVSEESNRNGVRDGQVVEVGQEENGAEDGTLRDSSTDGKPGGVSVAEYDTELAVR